MRRNLFLGLAVLVASTVAGTLWAGGCWDDGRSVNCVGTSCTYCVDIGGGTWSCQQIPSNQAALMCKRARHQEP